MECPAPFNSIYRPNPAWRISAVVFLVFGLFFAGLVWGEALLGLAEPRPKEMIIGALLVLIGAGIAAHAFTVSVRFTVDSIEYWSIIGVKRLPLDKVKGRREYVVSDSEGGGTRYLKLEPDDDRLKALSFAKTYNFDDAFYRWFYSLPDLDARDKEVHKDSNFGLV